MKVLISINEPISTDEVISIYKANGWSAAEKPHELTTALNNSHTLVTARFKDRLIGVGNAISDGSLVVYYPHLLVHPDFQGKGVGKKIMAAMQTVYGDFHQQMLTADL